MNYAVFGQSKDIAIVKVNNKGLLTTGPIPGTAVIHITAQEEFGINQTMVILVKVCTIFVCNICISVVSLSMVGHSC